MLFEVIIADEIGSQEDVIALNEAVYAGIKVFCTVHGSNIKDIKKRASLKSLIESKGFERYVLLGNGDKPGAVEQIFNHDFVPLLDKSRCNDAKAEWGSIISRRL